MSCVHLLMPTIRAVLAFALLGAALSSCSSDDNPDTLESATVQGVFRDATGRPMVGRAVLVSLRDPATADLVDSLVVATDASGRFVARFAFEHPTLPAEVGVEARPALGSGMSTAFDYGQLLRPSGSGAAFLRYDLTSYEVSPSVIGLRVAPLTREALVGHYSGYSVQPFYGWLSSGYLEFTFAPGSGDVTGTFGFEYSATILGGVGGAYGSIQHDTLYLQLNEVGGPRITSRAGAFKVIATSSIADTLIAWPDPCVQSCILTDAPVRLIRMP